MDISETYIRMCVKAEEIQAIWKKEYGDFVAVEVDEGTKVKTIFDGAEGEYTVSTSHISPYYWNIHNCTWLPRQDQLQDMVMPEFNVYGCDAIEHFMDDLHYFQKRHNPLFNSMEELTFAFVMHTRYNKGWFGSEWENETY